MRSTRIVVAGDSLALPRTAPEVISHNQVWPSILERSLAADGLNVRVLNHSRRGRTVPELAREFNDLVTLWEPAVCIIQVGIVDCAPRLFSPFQSRLLNSRYVHWRIARLIIRLASRYRRQIITIRPWVRYTSKRTFQSSLQVLARVVPSSIPVVVLPILTTFPEHERRSPGYNDAAYGYNRMWQEWCNATGSAFILEHDLLNGISVDAALLKDGHHLSLEGHSTVADALCDFFRRNPLGGDRIRFRGS